ncbi:MAG: hypothetical protein ACP5J4_11825 [Anaerolineae bacterium]
MPTDSAEFEALFHHYPEIIDAMPDTFTSHQFILALAQRYQRQYIELLYTYRAGDGPFRDTHNKLAKGLNRFPERVTKGERVNSADIFGSSGYARQWRKVAM